MVASHRHLLRPRSSTRCSVSVKIVGDFQYDIFHIDLTSTSVETRIGRWLELWDSSNQHRTGTAGDRETSNWLALELSNLGATPAFKEFPFLRREPANAHVTVGSNVFEGIPLFDGGTTHPSGIAARLSQSEESGTIVVVDASQRRTALATLRRSNNIQGIVVISGLASPGLALLNADFYEKPFGPPVLQVSSEYAETLLVAARKGREANLTVSFQCEDTYATNVQAKFDGRNPRLNPLVVMTPKSAWYTCTAERIGGIVAWLECARHFVSNPPIRDVIFTANTGHELGHIGLKRFLEENDRLLTRANLWVHFGANFASKDSRIRLQGSDAQYTSMLHSQLTERAIRVADVVPPGTRPGGEAQNIFDGSGSYASILGSNRLFHHPEDRFESNVDYKRMVQIKDALVESVNAWGCNV